MQLGPDEMLLAVDVKFRRGLDVQQLESIIDRIEGHIRQREPAQCYLLWEKLGGDCWR
jgi:hypothetical protein